MMRFALATTAAALGATAAHDTVAYDDGAPWGAANPVTTDHCASCHWERTPQQHSPQVTLRGLPAKPAANTTYALDLVFDDPTMKVSGFQIIALTTDGSTGRFTTRAIDSVTSADGLMIRSHQTRAAIAGRVRWRFAWQTNSTTQQRPVLLIAVMASNDDGSAFGDTVHYRRIEPVARQ